MCLKPGTASGSLSPERTLATSLYCRAGRRRSTRTELQFIHRAWTYRSSSADASIVLGDPITGEAVYRTDLVAGLAGDIAFDFAAHQRNADVHARGVVQSRTAVRRNDQRFARHRERRARHARGDIPVRLAVV